MDKKLSSYQKPPLTEVYLSVQFTPLANLDIPQLGSCWNLFKDRFPKYERHEPTVRVVERDGVQNSQASLQLQTVLPLPRLWFIDQDGTELVQIQTDKFIRNWRKAGETDVYPRYADHIRPKFLEDFRLFEQFVNEEKIGSIEVDQCEIAYINHITADTIWSNHHDISKVFRFWDSGIENEVGLNFEDLNLNARFRLLDDDNKFLGRLHISVQPASSKKGVPIFILSLTARGKPIGSDMESISDFMDKGREYIVRAFTAITTQDMHNAWDREI